MKGNQAQLLEGVQDCFKLQKVNSHTSTIEKQHGKIEQRSCSVIHHPTEIIGYQKWEKLQSVICIQSKREILATHKITEETRYYICSQFIHAKDALNAVRSHWSIENNLHWVLDMQFREDESRMCSGYSDQNFALIRKIVLNLMALDKKYKMSVNRKRLRASRNDEFRQYLLRV